MQDVTLCPQCRRRVLLPPELVGQLVQCPGCGTSFTAGEDDRAMPLLHGDAPLAPRANYERWEEPLPMQPPLARPRETERYEEHAEEEDRHRRYRRRQRADARHAVSAPATGLQVAGGIATGLAILLLLLSCGGMAGPRVGAMERFGGIVPGLVGLCWGLVVLLGGSKMKALDSYASAMTASVIAVIPCPPCWILGIPFGIWALVVLSRADVKEAFSGGRQ